MFKLRITIISLIFTLVSSLCFAEEFPYRKDYPGVPIIELKDLKAGYDEGSIVIVDVRSTLEFDTIHPKGASHVSLSNAGFEQNLQAFSEQNPGKKIAVYCNGITCLKSYNAAQKALDGETGQAAVIAEHAKSYATLLRGHIEKEDDILYPLAERVLPEGVRSSMLAAYAAAETSTPGLEEKYINLVEEYELQIK